MSGKRHSKKSLDLHRGQEGARVESETTVHPGFAESQMGAVRDLDNQRPGLNVLRTSSSGLSNSEEIFARSALNSLPANIALIATDGRIIVVNEAWRSFADQNDLTQQYVVGANYFDVCRSAAASGDLLAGKVLEGLLSIVNEKSKSFEIEYPCDSASQRRWFLMRASRSLLDPKILKVIHIDLTSHKNLEEALKKSREVFVEIFDVSPAIMFISSLADNRFIAANAAFERKSGWSRDEAIGRSSLELGFWESEKDYLHARQAIGATGRLDEWECRIRTKSGESLVGLLSAQQIQIDGDNCVVTVFEDITAHREIQERLQESEEKYHTVVEMAPDAICIADEHGHLIEANESACKQLGYTRQELLSLGIADIIPRERAESLESRLQVLTDVASTYDSFHRRSDGTVLPVELSVKRIVLNGQPAIIGIARDITERRKAQESVSLSESKYRRLHESMIDGFVLVDMEGRILDHNSSYASMLGYSPHELSQLTYSQITPGEWHSMEQKIVETQVLPRAHSDVYEKEYRRKDGTIFPVELRTFLLKNENGEAEGMWAIVRDITKRKQTLQRLKEANEQLNSVNAELSAEHSQLQNKHTALREVLQHIEEDKNEVRVHIADNMKMIIAPLLRNLQKGAAKNSGQARLLDVLERSLNDVTSPFVSHVVSKFAGLAPREIQVCGMVKDGLSSKEIAEHLGISVLTVNKLRQQIRHKLGIDNKDVGLSEYLQTL